MQTGPKRAVLIGLDGANYEAIKHLINEDKLPNFGELLREGVLCKNALAPYPTLTGSNWATIATGAWPGTHGVTDMSYHVTGEPLDYWHSGFTSDAVEAETLWEALAKVGKKSIVLKYTGSWPPRHPDILMVDGGGGRPFWGGSMLEISHSQLFSTEQFPNASTVELSVAKNWKGLNNSDKTPLEFRLEYCPETGTVPGSLQFGKHEAIVGKRVTFFGLIFSDGGKGYDSVGIFLHRSLDDPIAIIKTSQWSHDIEYVFEIAGQKKRGHFRIKLDQLDPDKGAFSIYFTQIYPTDEFSQPSEIGTELVEKFGSYINHPGYSEFAMGWFRDEAEAFIELMDYQNRWLGRAGRHLMQTQQWDLFAMQCHCLDFANHAFVPRKSWSKEERKKNLDYLARCYLSIDNMVGELLLEAGDDALVCVVSDHGATENQEEEVFINNILEEAGLLFRENQLSSEVRPKVDMSQTLAQQQRAAFIYLNLEGRDPQGIIPAAEYDKNIDRIIDALRNYREPTTGRNPFSMILRKEDARILGLYDSLGRDIGDIVYALLPEFDHEHGRQLPGAVLGGQSMKPLLVFKGPGVKADVTVERNVWLVDIVPTMAGLLNWPIPSEAEGALLYQIFAGHETKYPRQEKIDTQNKHLHELKKKLAELSKAKPAAQAATSKQEASPEREIEGQVQAESAPMPETVEELQELLLKAQAEATKWKSAYDKYHRITHGN